ncbi:MAG TPA: helix-turn-helix domain-containing protein [Paludibaculum sp.]|jgi:hypothetical protein
MSTATYRTSVAAKILDSSPHTLRRLAKAGRIDAEVTGGGQFRFPVAEVERLQREGLPPMPQESPDEDERIEQRPIRDQAEPDPEPDPEPEPDSPDVRTAREELSIAKTKVELRRVQLELEQTEDSFRERDRQAVAQQQAARRRQAEADEAAARKRWSDDKLEQAMRDLPFDCPPDIEETVATDVRRILHDYAPSDPMHVVDRLIHAAVERSLIPHRRQQLIQTAIDEAADSLPFGAKGWSEPTVYQIKARKLAAQAVAANAAGMGERELKQIARRAVLPVVRAFERAETVERLLLGLQWWELGRADQTERQAAVQAAKEALEDAAPTATAQQLEERMNKALRPHVQKVEARVERQRQQSEEQGLVRAALSHLSHILLCYYDWDSFSDRAETKDELSQALPEAIREAVEEGDVDASNLKEFVEAWVEEQLEDEEK